jgi:hypothetical protein
MNIRKLKKIVEHLKLATKDLQELNYELDLLNDLDYIAWSKDRDAAELEYQINYDERY